MLSFFPSQTELVQIAETTLIATVGGVGFYLIGFPGGLVSGSMLAVAIAALAGRPMKIPVPLARVCFVLVGILLGAVVTPDTLKGIAAWPLSVALLVIAAICMMAATAFYLRVVHGWDPLSALLGASPGSMAQVMALSAEFKADLRGIAIVHVMRVLLIVLGLPAGWRCSAQPWSRWSSTRGAPETSLVELAIARGGIDRLRRSPCCASGFPAACCSAPWPARDFLHGTGLGPCGHSPWWPGSAAVLTLGAVAGARFANTSPRMLLSYLGAAFGSFAVAVAVAASFALIVVALLPFRIADVVVAFAPGAQDTMMVLALALHLDPVYVGAHHLARFLVVSFSVAVVARRLVRKLPTPPPQSWRRPGQGTFDD